jgi:peptidoglycan/LPS O-acetylase OafA/YrhL
VSDAVPDAVAPPPRHPRFPQIDGLRALAVACVVAVHCAVFSGALNGSVGGRLLAHLNVGVTIFFVISGFLLYRPFIARRNDGPEAPAVATYAKRRLLRIYPAWWLVLTVLLVIPGLPSANYGHVWPMYLLLHTLPVSSGPLCSAQISECGLAQTWSLVAEVTFYAALPLYARATERATRGLPLRSWVVAQAAALTALSALSLALQYALAPVPSWVGWSVAGTVTWFALGMGLAVASVALEGGAATRRASALVRRGGWAAWLLAVAIYVGLGRWLPPTPFVLGAGHQLAISLAFGAIALLLVAPAAFVTGQGQWVLRITTARPVAWVGLVSYGIFLWHYAIVLKLSANAPFRGSFWLLLAATAALATACAAVSYYTLERPAMRLKYGSLGSAGTARRRRSGPSPRV